MVDQIPGLVDFTRTYRHRVLDEELDTLMPSLPALLLHGPKGVGKTATATQRCATLRRLDEGPQRAIVGADPRVIGGDRALSCSTSGNGCQKCSMLSGALLTRAPRQAISCSLAALQRGPHIRARVGSPPYGCALFASPKGMKAMSVSRSRNCSWEGRQYGAVAHFALSTM